MSTRTILDRYRTSSSYFARILHRLSGLLLTIYVLVYIWELGSITRGNDQSFNDMMATYNTPFWYITHILVISLIALHTLTGLRVMLFELGIGLKVQRASFWFSLIITLTLFVLLFIKVITKL